MVTKRAKKAKKPHVYCVYSLAPEIKAEVDRIAALCKIPKSRVVSEAIKLALTKFKLEPSCYRLAPSADA